MKTLATILFIVTLVCVVLLYLSNLVNKENQENAKRDRKLLLNRIESLEAQRDSLDRLANQYRDSSETWFASMVQARLQANLINQEVITLRKRQAAIRFLRTETDQQRDSVLCVLYPSVCK